MSPSKREADYLNMVDRAETSIQPHITAARLLAAAIVLAAENIVVAINNGSWLMEKGTHDRS